MIRPIVMRWCFAAAVLCFPVLAGAAEVPSGQKIVLHEVLIDDQDTVTYLRFRFLAPQIAAGDGQVTYDVAGQDMMHLCENLALPYVAEYALNGDRIVISFMDRITEFGQPDPDATQYFESFRPENGVCIWDDF
ncbi:DUF6497 family protein [Sulfitobacter sp. F26169L]|uniref:DUF6497 family protein n=1 Tax=Sulfitobacter sp. F26169L TaxID=2996015 RepID=UPI002260C298|nr:DUF6497 family protein [Sulfitobacter sp. F26169L]MCX7564816.1 DUF6497 family protein [Sulfitobacter sp. F26169L]